MWQRGPFQDRGSLCSEALMIYYGLEAHVASALRLELGARASGDMHVSNYADLRHSVTCLECIHVRDMR